MHPPGKGSAPPEITLLTAGMPHVEYASHAFKHSGDEHRADPPRGANPLHDSGQQDRERCLLHLVRHICAQLKEKLLNLGARPAAQVQTACRRAPPNQGNVQRQVYMALPGDIYPVPPSRGEEVTGSLQHWRGQLALGRRQAAPACRASETDESRR